ncbi:MAG: glycoside hydrolase family 30 protein [Clostridia bacterium]
MNFKSNEIKIVRTAEQTGERLSELPSVYFEEDVSERENPLIQIFQEAEYQTIEGFGAAFTEASSVTFDQMSPENQTKILDAYFNPQSGLGYSLCRTHINSCDFSTGNYDYVQEGDAELSVFDMTRDKSSLFPFILRATKVSNADFKLFASPWSPPAWMKTNGQMNQGGKLKPEFRTAWAAYFCRYIHEARKEGIPIWGVSVQNEPKAAQSWDSCIFTAMEERDFVRDYLGPALKENNLEDIKIIVWDHNKERVFERAKVYYSDPEAAKYIWGTGFHWYSGDHFENLQLTHEFFPDKKLLFTEGCQECGIHFGSWATGERYGHDILGNLNHWAVGFVDWNIILDEQGGPNHVGNYCDAPIIADTKNDQLHFQSSYYYIGHFSRYIRPGAKRIGFSRFTDKLEVTAFKNPDMTVAVVVLNRTDERIEYFLHRNNTNAKLTSEPHSIMTLLYQE